MRFSRFVLCSVLLAGEWGYSQNAQPQLSDPVALLQAVAKTYAAGAGTFRMEEIEESLQVNEFNRDWRKTYRTAIKGDGNLYRIEIRSGFGSYTQVSDGETEWTSQIEAKVYVKRPVPKNWPTMPKVMTSGEMELSNAWRMRNFLESEAAQYKHATFLPEETIQVEGHSFACYVVHVTSNDRDRSDPEVHSETTFWIDKKDLVFRKKIEQTHSYMIATAQIHIPFDEKSTVVYPVMDFHPKLDAALFRYSPPANSRQIASLEPSNNANTNAKPSANMVGEQAPEAEFLSKGNRVSLKSYEGKPILIDFWATWCGPCLLSMPSLARVYADTKDKGLIMLTVDEDALPEDALGYLARHHYGWANYHDEGKAEKAFKESGIPLTVLIDSKGKIVYYDFGGDEAALRSAIAGLGPEFSSVKNSSGQ